VVAGHTRLKAAAKLGLTTVPVYVAKNLTPAQAQAYRIPAAQIDNKLRQVDVLLSQGQTASAVPA
jgi:ParB-like chromosome segregation protein Spo0J